MWGTKEAYGLQYSGKENPTMETTIDSQIGNLVKLIEKKYISTSSEYRPLDFGEKGQFFTLDVISDLAFGHAFGFMEEDRDMYNYIEITKGFIPFMIFLTHATDLASLLHSRPLRGLFPQATDKLGFGAFIGYEHLKCPRNIPSAGLTNRLDQRHEEGRGGAFQTRSQRPPRHARIFHSPRSNGGGGIRRVTTPGDGWRRYISNYHTDSPP